MFSKPYSVPQIILKKPLRTSALKKTSYTGYLWSQQLGLYLGFHQGLLRFFTPDKQLVPTPEETADETQPRIEQIEQKAERLATKLRELNIDPDTI